MCFGFPVGLLFFAWFSWRNANLAGRFAGRLAFVFFGVVVCVVGGCLPTVLLDEFSIHLLGRPVFASIFLDFFGPKNRPF